MMRAVNILLTCFICSASAAYAVEENISAAALAKIMQQAGHSEGFEARLNILITKANGAHPAPFKLAVIGQFTGNIHRLSIRGISPETVRNIVYAAERTNDGRINGVESRIAATGGQVEFDPATGVFNSGLVIWDMFSPWWNWTKKTIEGNGRFNGHDCTRIHFWNEDNDSNVGEVESCVDQHAKIALSTNLFGKNHTFLRSAEVVQFMHKGDGGAMMAKKLKITDADRTVTDIEVYAGDEQYQITGETFAILDRQIKNSQRESK